MGAAWGRIGLTVRPELTEAIAFHEAIIAEGSKALVGYDTAKALANVVLLSEIPTTYDKNEQRQVNAGNLLLRGVPGVGKTFFGVILAAISDAKFARIQGRADLQPTEVVGFQMINPATGRARHRVRPAGVGRSDPARRDQPHPAQVAERVPRRAAGSHGHRRQDDLRAAGVQLRDRDDEPGRARPGHVPAVGSGDRSLRHHGQHRLPAARGRSKAGELRLQAGAAQRADVEGAHHPAARARSTQQVFLHERLGKYIQRLVAATRPYNPDTDWLQHSPSELVERGVDLGASPRAIICWGRLAKVWALLVRQPRPRSIRKTSRISRPTSSATGSGSGRTRPATG